MATYSTGITATWGAVPFAEVYELGLPLFGGPRKDRAASLSSQGWTDELGDISVAAYGSANMHSSEYGTRKQLVVSGGGVSLTAWALCTAVSATPELNGVTRYTFTAKLLEG